MLLKVHFNVHVNLKFSISFISACSCQPQVLVNLKFKSTSSSCQPVLQVDISLKVHINFLVNLKFSISFISAYSCQPQVHVNVRLMHYCICICTPYMHVHTKLACNVKVKWHRYVEMLHLAKCPDFRFAEQIIK